MAAAKKAEMCQHTIDWEVGVLRVDHVIPSGHHDLGAEP